MKNYAALIAKLQSRNLPLPRDYFAMSLSIGCAGVTKKSVRANLCPTRPRLLAYPVRWTDFASIFYPSRT